MYKKILVAVDGSDSARDALEHAAPLARAFGAKLLVVHVASEDQNLDDGRASARKIANAQISAANLEGVEAAPLVAFGDPADRIVEVADEHAVDLIVVGSRGLSGLQSFLLGSVSYNVARRAHRPVLIVHRADASAM